MKGFIKLYALSAAMILALFLGANFLLSASDDSGGRPYCVEAERIAAQIQNGETPDLSAYSYITKVTKQEGSQAFFNSESDYLVKEIDGALHRFDYNAHTDTAHAATVLNVSLGVVTVLVMIILTGIYLKIIRPFEKIRNLPAELAKGNLTTPLTETKGRYFGKFIWGLDLLREELEKKKSAELALQKQNKTLVLSLSHDIKTPLGIIELNAKALERGLYSGEDKKKEVACSISDKCEEIRGYVDKIAVASGDDFLNLEVRAGEFYLSDLIGQVKAYYTDKLRVLKTDFEIGSYSDCLLSGDADRALEVLQNVIENAVKYGDGRKIIVSFAAEEECRLITVSNGGCTLSPTELPHIFDSFWRGSNAGNREGSGLGLYICRRLMRKMNGDIFAETDKDNISITMVFSLA